MIKSKKRGRKGLSPVIATVLLIVIVLILAIIIFLWARGFIKEKVEKFGASIDKSCQDVNLGISISTGAEEIYIINNGRVPVYKIDIKMKSPGTSETLSEMIDLGSGGSTARTLVSPLDYDEIVVIPVLRGQSGSEIKEYTCNEKHGIECINENDEFIC